jgi:hypothetical protein
MLLALLALVVAALAFGGWLAARRYNLRRRFGPEYDRVVAERDSHLAAERELIDRQRRHNELRLRTIAPAARDRFIQRWRVVQAKFVDDPAAAVVAGDQLVTELVRERGYPTRDYEDQLSLLSVDHARTLGSYRDAHDIFLRAQRGEATTEDLRQALVHYRDLFADILGVRPATDDDGASAASVRPTTRHETEPTVDTRGEARDRRNARAYDFQDRDVHDRDVQDRDVQGRDVQGRDPRDVQARR